jgi:hypothetical protein
VTTQQPIVSGPSCISWEDTTKAKRSRTDKPSSISWEVTGCISWEVTDGAIQTVAVFFDKHEANAFVEAMGDRDLEVRKSHIYFDAQAALRTWRPT